MGFSVKTDNVTLINLYGRFTLNSSRRFRCEAKEALAHDSRKFLVDLEQLRYIDATGLGELISVCLTIKSAGGDMVLCSVREKILDLLQITKLYTAFNIFNCQKDALRYLTALA